MIPPGTDGQGPTLLPDLARGLMDLGNITQGNALNLPYPSSIQRALDRIVLTCLREGRVPPFGVPDLAGWCTAPLAVRWPSSAVLELLDTKATLLDPRRCLPTRSCAELASYGPDGLVEQGAMLSLRELAQTVPTPAMFERCREFLIDRVVVTNHDARDASWRPMIWKFVQHLYQPPSPVHVTGGLATCPTCGLIAMVEHGRVVWCEGEVCGPGLASGLEYELSKVRVLGLSLRLFLSLPGRTERPVMRRLAALGVTGTLLPDGLGAYQLSEPVLGRSTMQVFDRVEPALLAAGLAGRSDLLAVLPDRLMRARPALLESVRRALPPELDVEVTTETAMAEGAREDA